MVILLSSDFYFCDVYLTEMALRVVDESHVFFPKLGGLCRGMGRFIGVYVQIQGL